jgi:hypothetical protein
MANLRRRHWIADLTGEWRYIGRRLFIMSQKKSVHESWAEIEGRSPHSNDIAIQWRRCLC